MHKILSRTITNDFSSVDNQSGPSNRRGKNLSMAMTDTEPKITIKDMFLSPDFTKDNAILEDDSKHSSLLAIPI